MIVTRVGRNEPCPCGSGLKHKRCCLGDCGSPTGEKPGRPLSPFSPRSDDAEISDPSDVLPYCNHQLSRLAMLEVPRNTAVLHACRAMQTLYVLRLAGGSNHPFSPESYSSMRSAQNAARYLIYDLFTKCPPGGDIRPSTYQEIELALATSVAYSAYSMIHDALLGTEIGQTRISVDHRKRVVSFHPTAGALVDMKRGEWQMLEHRRAALQQLHNTAASGTAGAFRTVVEDILSTLDYDADRACVFYRFSQSQLRAIADILASQWEGILTGPGLPDDWRCGAFSSAEFRNFWKVLQALTALREFACFRILEREGSQAIPFNSSVVLMHSAGLSKHICSCADLAPSVAGDITRDLTYDPIGVKWTEVQYQPLVPTLGSSYVLTPVVIGGNNFERNYAAIIDRLSWRRSAADSLKQSREGQMLAALIPVVESLGLHARPRVLLGKGSRPAGDIDLLLWDDEGEDVMPISLKWFYGPDSVREVANHAERYREAFRQIQRSTDYLQDHLQTVVSNHSLSPPISHQARLMPVLVLSEDLPLERDRCASVPCATQDVFARILRESSGSLCATYRELQTVSVAVPDLDILMKYEEVAFGTYTFRIPKGFVADA